MFFKFSYNTFQFLILTILFLYNRHPLPCLAESIEKVTIFPSVFVRVNTSVTFTVHLNPKDHLSEKRKLFLMVRKGDITKGSDPQYLSEGCLAYHKELYKVDCEPDPENWDTAVRMKFTILSVNWTDRDMWYFFLGQTHKSELLNVFDAPRVNPARVTAIGQDNSVLHPVSYGGNFQGSGTRTNPYDLRPPGFRMNVTCSTECGFPSTRFKWLTANDSRTVSIENSAQTPIESHDSNCSTSDPFLRGKVRSQDNLTIDCEKMNLIGLNSLTCEAFGEQYDPNVPKGKITRTFYLLCPGGHRPMTVNLAEKIAIGVGGVIGLLFLVCGCILVRRHCKNDYMGALQQPPPSYSHTTLHV